MSDYGFTTRTVHAAQDAGAEHGAVHMPIHTSVQYGFQKVEDLIGVFQGRIKGGFNYARQGTPTTAALEALITRMEGGVGSVSFATGMAAITATFLTLLRAGDHVVSSKFVFGNTNSLFGTLADLGIDTTKVDTGSVANVEAALRPNTRLVFVETISNPGTRIPDLAAIGQLCRERGLVYVVDNTVTSPYLFQPKSVGASLVINALTKSIAGHGDALGGTVTDTGLFDWQGYPNIFAHYRSGDARQWGLTQIRKKGLRDMGGALSSDHAHRILVGAETLELRCDRTSATALALARWLQAHPAIAQVHYPMLENHPQHAAARRHFKSGSWLLSFELADPQRLVPVIDKLKLPVSATGLADTRSLIIPVAPTIFWEAGAAVRADMGIADGMIRLSVGLEDERDLIADFEQALA
ncbi:MAG: cystathionine gamma-synthase family protein [Aquincola sp.]|nr:cystathionine gamma-synthase family protein [Aquincola sp.]